jgi:YgiT-type zinc finger domain-containing protein
MYDFTCEHFGVTVRERRVDREALRHKGSFVIFEDVPVDVCDKCGARYFDASILRRVAEIGRGTAPPLRTVEVPVDRYTPACPSEKS